MSNYPDGAEFDPSAPWNEEITEDCEICGQPLSERNIAEEYDGCMCKVCYQNKIEEE
jgi:formylmethanofuran dehydrogenase subunit E